MILGLVQVLYACMSTGERIGILCERTDAGKDPEEWGEAVYQRASSAFMARTRSP